MPLYLVPDQQACPRLWASPLWKGTTLVVSNSTYRNEGIEAMHGVLGYDCAHPVSYRRIAQEQIEKYGDGIHFRDGEAVRVGKIDWEGTQGFQVQLRAGKVVKGKKLVLAVGSRDAFPNIDGYVENWPENIDPALREAAKAAELAGCVFEERRIVKFDWLPDGQVGVNVRLEDGSVRRMGYLADKPPTEVVGERMLVDGLGVEIARDALGSFIKRSEPFGEIIVKGCFVVGDAGTSLKQVTVAVSHGMLGTVGVSMQICAAEAEKALVHLRQGAAEKGVVKEQGRKERMI